MTVEPDPVKTEDTQKRKRWWNKFPFVVNLTIIIAVTLLIRVFVFNLYLVPSASMEPTIRGDAGTGDRIAVNKLAYVLNDIERGDIIVFTGPDGWDAEDAGETLVKRVIAIEGDTVSCCSPDGRLLVNGEPLDEPYVKYNFRFEEGVLDCSTDVRSKRCFPTQTVPEGQVWVMGDNRSNSKDSSFGCNSERGCQGPVPEELVIGEVKFSFWFFGI